MGINYKPQSCMKKIAPLLQHCLQYSTNVFYLASRIRVKTYSLILKFLN